MRRLGYLLLVLSFALLASGLTHLTDVSIAQSSCDETVGRTERNDFYAENISTRIYYTVYLPPCYDSAATTTYPAMYLMHGSNDDDGSWGRLGLYDVLDAGISTGQIPPVIAVMPFGEWVANENRFDAFSWPDVFLNQLMPLVEAQYRISDEARRRAIGGISRGGFWAFHIGLKNPDLFSIVGGHSGFFDRYHAEPDDNPLDLVLEAPNIENMRLWIDRGADDYAAPGLDLMGEHLAERGLDYQYIIHPEGQHYFTYWQQHIADYVEFYVADWQAEQQVTPETQQATVQSQVFVTNTPRPQITSIAPTAISMPTVEASPTVEPTIESEESKESAEGAYVVLPVTAFPSFLQSNMSMEQLMAVLFGENDPLLVLPQSTVAVLLAQGYTIGPEVRVVPDDEIYRTLWADRRLYSLLPFDQLTTRYRVLTVDNLHPLDRPDYPLVFESDTPNFYPDRLTRLLMSGVTAIARESVAAFDANGVEWAAEGIQDYVIRADYFHISNEVSIALNCPQSTGELLGGNNSMCSKAQHFEVFNLLDVDIVELSGNHNNDHGYQAYLDTLAWYAENDVSVVGGGETLDAAREPLIIAHNGNQIALLACNWVGPYYALVNEDPAALGGVRPGAADCDREWLRETLPQLAAQYDQVIVSVQYFEVDQFEVPDENRAEFVWLAELGADVVLGTSAHFPMPFEFISQGDADEGFIHYGLGNLYFDQEFFGGTRFFLDQFYIYEGQLVTVDLFTGIIEDQGRPRPMTADERENFLFLIFNQYGGF